MDLGGVMNQEKHAAMADIAAKVSIGTGWPNSATIGAKTVAILPPMLQMPKAVPAKTAGNS